MATRAMRTPENIPTSMSAWPTAGGDARAAWIVLGVLQLVTVWPDTTAQQPSPPPSLLEGLCQLEAAREGLEVLCCGGMRCIENSVFPLQCSLGCAEMWMPATAACRRDEHLMGIAVDTDGIGFFDALCSEVPGVAAISAEESLCYLAGIALAEVPLSPDRCMAVDELIAMQHCEQPLLNAEGTLQRLQAMRQEQCTDESDIEEQMEAWDDELLSAVVVEMQVTGTSTFDRADFLERVADALGLDSSQLVILNPDNALAGRRRRTQDAVVMRLAILPPPGYPTDQVRDRLLADDSVAALVTSICVADACAPGLEPSAPHSEIVDCGCYNNRAERHDGPLDTPGYCELSEPPYLRVPSCDVARESEPDPPPPTPDPPPHTPAPPPQEDEDVDSLCTNGTDCDDDDTPGPADSRGGTVLVEEEDGMGLGALLVVAVVLLAALVVVVARKKDARAGIPKAGNGINRADAQPLTPQGRDRATARPPMNMNLYGASGPSGARYDAGGGGAQYSMGGGGAHYNMGGGDGSAQYNTNNSTRQHIGHGQQLSWGQQQQQQQQQQQYRQHHQQYSMATRLPETGGDENPMYPIPTQGVRLGPPQYSSIGPIGMSMSVGGLRPGGDDGRGQAPGHNAAVTGSRAGEVHLVPPQGTNEPTGREMRV